MPARIITGTVISNSNDKTIVVNVNRKRRHPLYDKSYTVSKKIQAHDETNQAKVGDTVRVGEVKPISRHKTWKLLEIVESEREMK